MNFMNDFSDHYFSNWLSINNKENPISKTHKIITNGVMWIQWHPIFLCKNYTVSPDLTSCVQSLSHVLLIVTPWAVAHQASLSMGFSKQEYWSGLPFPSPGGLPDPGIKPTSHSAPAIESVMPSVQHQLPESTQTHVHWVGDAIQPSHPVSSPSPALNLSQHQGLFKWVSSSHQVAKVLEFQL